MYKRQVSKQTLAGELELPAVWRGADLGAQSGTGEASNPGLAQLKYVVNLVNEFNTAEE